MIKFFRTFRKTLIGEGKTRRYFLYAIGEVSLVVIGILIAVQINNWNEQKNARVQEIKILNQLNIDLKENLKEITDNNQYSIENNISGGKILHHLENETMVTDSLKYWVETFSSENIFNNANTTYRNIENSAENIITNDSIRLQITLMYESEFKNIHKRETMVLENFHYRYKNELLKNFKTSAVMDPWLEGSTLEVNTPINFSELKKNEMYKNMLVEYYNFRLLRIKWAGETITSLKKLIINIDEEIKLLESK